MILINVVSVIVMLGWFVDIPLLTSVHSDFPSMKFTTALLFFMSSIGHILRDRQVQFICSFLSIAIVYEVLFISIGSGHEPFLDPFTHVDHGVKTVMKGLPSIATMLLFVLNSLIVFTGKQTSGLTVLGIITPAIAVIGYLFNIPSAYYYFPGKSTGMAIHTAILFIILFGSQVRNSNISRGIQ